MLSNSSEYPPAESSQGHLAGPCLALPLGSRHTCTPSKPSSRRNLGPSRSHVPRAPGHLLHCSIRELSSHSPFSLSSSQLLSLSASQVGTGSSVSSTWYPGDTWEILLNEWLIKPVILGSDGDYATSHGKSHFSLFLSHILSVNSCLISITLAN